MSSILTIVFWVVISAWLLWGLAFIFFGPFWQEPPIRRKHFID